MFQSDILLIHEPRPNNPYEKRIKRSNTPDKGPGIEQKPGIHIIKNNLTKKKLKDQYRNHQIACTDKFPNKYGNKTKLKVTYNQDKQKNLKKNIR